MNPDPFKPCAVIPVYNHGAKVGTVVAALRTLNLPCMLVDDGSDADCATVLDALAGPGVTLVRRAVNGGKGVAVQEGLRAAAAAGYTHALQIDADGQHDLDDAQRLLDKAQAEPRALVCGQPVFGDEAPRVRFYGRRLTSFWVWINTLSSDIPDAMCGFRVYPLAQTLPVLPGSGDRMDFDIGVLVHLRWANVPMCWIPTRVSYPVDGVSHFRGLADNWLISRMHARLFFGMLRRLPRLLWRHVRPGS